MAEKIRASRWCINASPRERKTDDARNARAGQWPKRCYGSQENAVAVGRWTGVSQIVDDRVTGFLGQRKPYLAASFTADTQGRFAPINVVEAHARDVAGAQAKTRKQLKMSGIPVF
jgi:hypothetical protein